MGKLHRKPSHFEKMSWEKNADFGRARVIRGRKASLQMSRPSDAKAERADKKEGNQLTASVRPKRMSEGIGVNK